jgi:Tol biopolymer transport system component
MLGPRVSPDGRKSTVTLPEAPKGQWETWLAELGKPGIQRLLAAPNADMSVAVWSRDSRRIAFSRVALDNDDGIYVQQADGTGNAQLVLKVESRYIRLTPFSWNRDGSALLVGKFIGDKSELLLVTVPRDGKPGTTRKFRETASTTSVARISPDGNLVAFGSDESGKAQIYAAALTAEGTPGMQIPVSTSSDVIDALPQLAWAANSRRLFFSSNPGKLMSVDIETKPALSATAPIVVQNLNKLRIGPGAWDILPDGRLLAIQRSEAEEDLREFNVILNWLPELRERMKHSTSSGTR